MPDILLEIDDLDQASFQEGGIGISPPDRAGLEAGSADGPPGGSCAELRLKVEAIIRAATYATYAVLRNAPIR
jgi:hypothetical protein